MSQSKHRRDYQRYLNRMRRLHPGLAEREIGLAYMRAETAAAGQAEVPLGEPEEFIVPNETIAEHGPVVVVHLLCWDGSTLNAAVPVSDVRQIVELWDRLNFDRIDIRDFINDSFELQRHTEQEVAQAMITGAIYNALTSANRDAIQARIDTGHCRLMYQIARFQHPSGPAINFRVIVGDTREPLAAALAVAAGTPRTTTSLAARVKPRPS